MGVHHLDEVRRKIADLRKIERVLREMAAQCDGGTVPECPVIDALFDHTSDMAPGSLGGNHAAASPDHPSLRIASKNRRGRGTEAW